MTLELDKVTIATFEPHIGSAFAVRNSDAVFVLDSVSKLKSGSPARPEAFALYFRCEAQGVLPQQTYDLAHETLGELSIFLVPIRESGKGVLYEAVFN